MSLPNYLAKIKSSGIYRFVWDKSEVAGTPAETLRLVVGYSEKGPFNTPTYIQSASEFIQIYGNINKKLERRGVYFHRLALQALTAGPILALNLKKFDKETVQAISFAPDQTMFKELMEGETEIRANIQDLGIEDIYDTNRFWVLDANKMQNKTQHYVSISATDSRECSNTIFMRGAKVDGYNLSVSEWYSSATTEEIPSYFEGYESLKIEDFFAEIYVFRGQFTKEIASSNELSKYFNIDKDGNVTVKRYLENAFGEKVDGLVALSQNENSNFIKRYEGILLPNFKNSQNQYISLDLLFNSDNYEHKMLMDFNIEKLEDGDITVDTLQTSGYNKDFSGILEQMISNIEDPEAYEAIRSRISIFNNYSIVPEISFVTGYQDGKWEYKNAEYVAEPHFYVYDVKLEDLTPEQFNSMGVLVGDRFLGEGGKVATLTSTKEEAVYETIEPENKEMNTGASKADMAAMFGGSALAKDGNNEIVNTLLKEEGLVVGEASVLRSEMFVAGENGVNKTITIKAQLQGYENFDIMYFEDTESAWKKLNITDPEGHFTYGPAAGFPVPANMAIEGALANYIQFIGKNVCDAKLTLQVCDMSGNVLSSCTTEIKVGEKQQQIAGYKTSLVFDTEVNTFGGLYLAKCNRPISADNSTMVPVYLKGYEYGKYENENGKLVDNSKPASGTQWDKLQWQQFILSALTDYRGIRTALTSRQDVDYRYIVDTFEGFVEAECKAKIATIAKEKDNALAFLNFPSAYTFTNCDYTSFTDNNNRFQVKYIKDGGNKVKNPAVLFSLVSEANGASYVSYNTPLTFTDGTVKTYVPSAALVSNNFMQKYTSRQPYYIVAGPNYGRIIFDGCVGPDYNFSRADLDILEPMGVNCMVYVPRKGTYINSNQTAKQNPVTALSKVHVRELVIFLQDEIEALLQNYQWEFNTQALRDTVKAKADTICENVKANGGLYAYVNRCDSSNNTNDVIDNEMFVLSTEIEPSRGAGKMVQELTIHKTGGLTATIK